MEIGWKKPFKALLCLRHISCRDLDSSYLKLLINYSFYTTVTIIGGDDNHRQQQRKTSTVVAKGRDLRWEQEETLNLELFSEENHVYVEFEFFCHYGVFPLKDAAVGKAVVPIKDLMEKQCGSLSYQVKSTSGGSNDGMLTFLFHVFSEPMMTGGGYRIPLSPADDWGQGQPSSLQSCYSYSPPAAPNDYYCCYYPPLPPHPPEEEGYWQLPPPIWPSESDSYGNHCCYYHYEPR